jgi:dsRNA-specific ribonuclease
VKQKVAPPKNLEHKQMENLIIEVLLMKIKKNITVETLFKNYKMALHLFFDRRLKVVLVLNVRNTAGLKKLSSFV